MVYRKNSFVVVDYVKIIELHIVHTWRHTDEIVDEIADAMISL